MTPAAFKALLQAAVTVAEMDVLMIQHWREVVGTMDELRDLQFEFMARYESVACHGCEGQSVNAHHLHEEAA